MTIALIEGDTLPKAALRSISTPVLMVTGTPRRGGTRLVFAAADEPAATLADRLYRHLRQNAIVGFFPGDDVVSI